MAKQWSDKKLAEVHNHIYLAERNLYNAPRMDTLKQYMQIVHGEVPFALNDKTNFENLQSITQHNALHGIYHYPYLIVFNRQCGKFEQGLI